MIENVNASKNPSEINFDIRKYIGVASVNVLAVNPNNEKLRKYGWSIPEDAEEPIYVSTRTDESGKSIQTTRVRFLVQIHDLEEKPVISLDFFCTPEYSVNKEGSKCKIIDEFGRTAWATKAEIEAKAIPMYSNGSPANISSPYRLCHKGEEELVSFLFKYLNITPFQIFDRVANNWKQSKNPGRLTIDNWKALCNGDVKEIAGYLALQPDNKVKVVLGLRTTDENRAYQTFLNTGYIGNGSVADMTGKYVTATKLIENFYKYHDSSLYKFEATPVHEWKPVATEVQETTTTMFDDQGNYVADDNSASSFDDLPFGN